MHLTYRNVNTAFTDLVSKIHTGRIATTKKESRNGNVLMIEEPVIITYEKPKERVLFNTDRDCNPFFHLFESLWMLAGRNDVAPLSYYNSKIADFSDDGKTFNGAYGWRWRNWQIPTGKRDSREMVVHVDEWETVDQLQRIIQYLKDDPNGRRAVLEMWSVHSDLNRITTSKDVCCNTHVYFSIREVAKEMDDDPDTLEFYTVLNMTVCNRSNDMILGMLGANQVHFSFLQEYIANSLGVEVGVYNQMTNNLHVYEWNWKPMEWSGGCRTMHDPPEMSYDWIHENKGLGFVPYDVTREEANEFVEVFKDGNKQLKWKTWKSRFLNKVALPMCQAFRLHKFRDYSQALMPIEHMESYDWKIVAHNWITKRKQNWERKQSAAKTSKDKA